MRTRICPDAAQEPVSRTAEYDTAWAELSEIDAAWSQEVPVLVREEVAEFCHATGQSTRRAA